MRPESILVTGGAGFVGSHIARAAHEAGHRVAVLDDLMSTQSCSWPEFTGCADLRYCEGDVGDRDFVSRVLVAHKVSAVVHCAGLICVGESVKFPGRYFNQNVARFLTLLNCVRGRPDCVVVLSSSAAVYGPTNSCLPFAESDLLAPSSPYGATKLCAELALRSYAGAYDIPWAALRYFNAAGAHPSGELAERHEPETHLIPLAIAAAESGQPLQIFGDDYQTPDGAAVRDYVHVWDLARAHLSAIDALRRGRSVGACNLGAGRGHSVREVAREVGRVTGRPVHTHVAPRRLGDPAHLVADVSYARDVLGWAPGRSDLPTIVSDAVRATARCRTATRSAG